MICIMQNLSERDRSAEMIRENRRKQRWSQCIWVIPVLVGLAAAVICGRPSVQERKLQQEIAGQILRFHVLANSDSSKDQEEKLRVRDAVLDRMQILLHDEDREETIQSVEANLQQIEDAAQSVVPERKVEASVVTDWFPEKTYGDCTFPEGDYKALRIEIGKADGHNWWCVLYPSLCFTDAVHPVMDEESKEKLSKVLDDQAYDFIIHPAKTKIRFRWF